MDLLPALLILSYIGLSNAAEPGITNVHVFQDSIEIHDNYCKGIINCEVNSSGSDSFLLAVQISSDNGASWMVPLESDFFLKVAPGSQSIPFRVQGHHGDNCRVKITLYDTLPTEKTLRKIPASGHAFLMGSDNHRAEEGPRHTVIFTHDFWIDTVEMNEARFKLFKPDYIPQYLAMFFYKKNRPVDNCFWHWAIRYCNWRSKQEGFDTCYVNLPESTAGFNKYFNIQCDPLKNGYRLPTEAEWEYACRAGTMTDYFWGNDSSMATISKYCWYYYNSNDTIHDPAELTPNRFGLYDISGGMLELCNDWYDTSYYSHSPIVDPRGPEKFAFGSTSDPYRVTRGGHFQASSSALTSSTRIGNFSSARHPQSFRCVRTVLP
jgi:formylglycine-generating enzyme required for sulfatase activity